MERYLYFLLASSLVLGVVLIYLLRKDLAPVILGTGIFGALWGPVSEYWYFRDYWRPKTIFGNSILEDVLFGFGLTALGACSYKLWFLRGTTTWKPHRPHYSLPAVFVAVHVSALLVFSMVLGVNSILVASMVYVVLAGWIALQRRDLTGPSILSGIIMAVYSLVIYGVGLNFLVDGQKELARIWLLNGTRYGITVLGNVPLTEVVWFLAWGCISGIAYEYATGRGLQRFKKGAPP
jgi:hypothetical protein